MLVSVQAYLKDIDLANFKGPNKLVNGITVIWTALCQCCFVSAGHPLNKALAETNEANIATSKIYSIIFLVTGITLYLNYHENQRLIP